jgi:NADH-quinone oxidoreductase subunit N
MNYSVTDIIGILPELLLVVTALLAILVDIASGERNPSASAMVSGIGFVAAGLAALIGLNSIGGTVMAGAVFHDGFTAVFRVVFCLIGLFTVLFSPAYLKRTSIRLGEYYSLLVMCVFGMMVMVSAANLLLFFIGLEIMSIALYVLTALHRADARSVEAGMKYLILGAFSSAFLLYGIALIFAVVGSIEYSNITAYFLSGPTMGPLTIIAVALMLTGFAFKIAAVPFHFWSPDVYEGAPTTITGFMSTGPKAAAFVVLIRVFGVALHPIADHWTVILTWVAVATMTVGNILALKQTSIKRMLAYSSVAHAGYLLVGIVAGTHAAFAATGYYLAAYALMNLGAFAVIILMNQREGTDGEYRFDALRGMGFERPLLGVTMTIFMLSLTGMPPTAGFFGKLYVFSAAIEQGHIVLAVIGLLNSAVAAYYYLRIITLLYMSKAEGPVAVPQPMSYSVALVISSILILLVGMFPEQVLSMMIAAAP